jgi:hypothetical protein
MGWLIYNTPPQSVQRKIASLCTFETEARRARPVALAKVLEPGQVGPVWYAAVRCELITPESVLAHSERGDYALQADQSYAFAAVFLTTEEEGWGYKDMDETSGPVADHAPAFVLDMLTPTSSDFALNWRHRCGVNLTREHLKAVVLERYSISKRAEALASA